MSHLSSPYMREQIITYLGNKRALLGFLAPVFDQVKTALGKDKLRVLDAFSGSGIVSRFARAHADYILANDLETYSRIINTCYLSVETAQLRQQIDAAYPALLDWIDQNLEAGFITELYAPKQEDAITVQDRVFYTRRNAIYLDTARRAIATLPESLQPYFLAPLLSYASVHANTSGVFKGFYKNKQGIGQYGGTARNALSRIKADIQLASPVLCALPCTTHVTQCDVGALMHSMPEVDLAYFDPPYNQHPYGSNYFMLNLLCDYQPPETISVVSGIPKDWNRSAYNKPQLASNALFDAVAQCRAPFVLISYNSEGFIAHDTFLAHLNQCGSVTCMDTEYNTFRGSRNLRDRTTHVREYLYLVDKS